MGRLVPELSKAEDTQQPALQVLPASAFLSYLPP